MAGVPNTFSPEVARRAEELARTHLPAAIQRVIDDADRARSWSNPRTQSLVELVVRAIHLCVERGPMMPDQALALEDLLRGAAADQPVPRATRRRTERGLVHPIEQVLSTFAAELIHGSQDVLGRPDLVHLKTVDSPSRGRASACVAWQGKNPKTEAPFAWQLATIVTDRGAPVIAHVLPVPGPEFRLNTLRKAAGDTLRQRRPRSLAADKADATGVADYPITTADLLTMPHTELTSACGLIDQPELVAGALFIGGTMHVPHVMPRALDMEPLSASVEPLHVLNQLGRPMLADLCADGKDATRVDALKSLRWTLAVGGGAQARSWAGAELYDALVRGDAPWEEIDPALAPQGHGPLIWLVARGSTPPAGDVTLLVGLDTLVRRTSSTIRISVGHLHGTELRRAMAASAADSFGLHGAKTGAVAGAVRLAKRSGALHVQPRKESGTAMTSLVLCAASALLVADAEAEQRAVEAA